MEEDKINKFEEFRREKMARNQGEVEKIVQKVEKRNRVHTTDYILMVGTALFFDALQAAFSAIPVAGWMLASGVGFFAWLTFYLWTSVKGWGMSDSIKQFLVNWVLPLAELVPILGILPVWTVRVFLQLSFLKAEDVVYNASGGRADIEKLTSVYQLVTSVGRSATKPQSGKVIDLNKLNNSKSSENGPYRTINEKIRENNQQIPDTEMSKLKSEISAKKAEIQRLEIQLTQKRARFSEIEENLNNSVKIARESGSMDENQIKRARETGQRSTMPLFTEITNLSNRINGLKNYVHNSNARLAELENRANNYSNRAA